MAEYIERQKVFDSLPVVTEDKQISLYGAVADFMVLVSAIPTADVQEVRRGEWRLTQEPLGWNEVDCVECSACGDSWVMDEDFDFDDYEAHWNYCPNCGAKMDGKGEKQTGELAALHKVIEDCYEMFGKGDTNAVD